MTAFRRCGIKCDVCGVTYQGPPGLRYVADVRLLAIQQGWRTAPVIWGRGARPRDTDRCPSCLDPKKPVALDVELTKKNAYVLLPRRMAAYAATVLEASLRKGELADPKIAQRVVDALRPPPLRWQTSLTDLEKK